MISGFRPIRSDSQPAMSGIGTLKHDEDAVHEAGRRLVEADDRGQVESANRLTTPSPRPPPPRTEVEVDPAQVAVAEDRRKAVADAAAGDGGGAVGAGLADEQEDREGDEDRRDAEQRSTTPRQPMRAMSGAPRSADDDRPDVAAGDVGADREAAPILWELLGEQAVADGMLRRAADPRRDVGDRERGEGLGECLGDEAAAEQDPAGAEDAAPRDRSG